MTIPNIGYLSGFAAVAGGTHYQSTANAPGTLAGNANGFIASALFYPPGIDPTVGAEIGHVAGVFDLANTQGWNISYTATPSAVVITGTAYDSLGASIAATAPLTFGAGPLAIKAALVHLVYDTANGSLDLYINGEQVNAAAAANPFAPATRPFSIGLDEAADANPVLTGGISAVGFRNGAPAAVTPFLVSDQWQRAARGAALPQTDAAGADFYNHLFSVRRGQPRPTVGVADIWNDEVGTVVLQKSGNLAQDTIVTQTGLADWI